MCLNTGTRPASSILLLAALEDQRPVVLRQARPLEVEPGDGRGLGAELSQIEGRRTEPRLAGIADLRHQPLTREASLVRERHGSLSDRRRSPE